MSNNIKKITALLKMKQMYLTIVFITVLIFLLSVVQNNTILESMVRACIGTIISTIVITTMWVIIYNVIEPFVPGLKKEDDVISNDNISDNSSEPIHNPEIAISDDDINIRDIFNERGQTLDISNEKENTAVDNPHSLNNLEINNSFNTEKVHQKNILNENKEVDNSNELLYHGDVSTLPKSDDYDTESIDLIISSNNVGKKSDKEELLDIDQLIDKKDIKNTKSVAGNTSNFEDFSNPALTAQVIRTLNAKDEGKGNT